MPAEIVETETQTQDAGDAEVKSVEAEIAKLDGAEPEGAQPEPEKTPETEASPKAEATEQPATQPKPEDDPLSGVYDLQEGQKPTPDDWRKARESFKARLDAERTKRQQVEAEAAELRRRPAEAAAAVTPSEAPKNAGAGAVTTEQTFRMIARAMSGEYTNPGQNEEVLRLGVPILNQMSVDELVTAIDGIDESYGSQAEQLRAIAERKLSVALARARSADGQVAETEKRREQYRTQNAMSFERVYAAHPELRKTDSELRKTFDKTLLRLIGKLDEKGNFVERGIAPEITMRPNWPEVVIEEAIKSHRLEKAGDIDKILAENKSMKEQLEAARTPASGRRPPIEGGAPTGDPEIFKVEQELADLDRERGRGR